MTLSIILPVMCYCGVMVKSAGGESLTATVYEQLRSSILNGEVAPGRRLQPAEIGGRFGVSPSVVREVLGLLAAKDLVRIDRNKGCRVTSVSLEALSSLTEARVINEGTVLRLSVLRGDVTWESEALAAHHRLASKPMFLPGPPPARNKEWARAHLDFHQTLIKACGNPVLLGICAQLSDAAELYRAWSAAGTLELNRDVAGEHQALLDAALAHDEDRAADLFKAHLDRTRQIMADLGFASRPRPRRPPTAGPSGKDLRTGLCPPAGMRASRPDAAIKAR
jgi:DNA-binding GntR family transcriptional regulator